MECSYPASFAIFSCNYNFQLELLLLLYPFNSLFQDSLLSRYQKGTTSLDLNEAGDDGVPLLTVIVI